MPESEPFSLSLDLSWAEDENGVLIVSGCASVPEEDTEHELVMKEAIEEALPDFMNLAVLHLDHTERPVGLITSGWFEGNEFHIRSPIKMTPDCKDVRDRIRSGELSQFSIFGRRIKGSPSCSQHPDHRTEPCKTFRLFLDSVSICPGGNAINKQSYLEHNGGIVVKSLNSDSAMIHETADGIQEKSKMTDENGTPPDTSQILQQILETVTGMDDRLTALENTVREMTDYEPDEGIEKAEDEEYQGDYDGAEDTGTGDIQESLSTLAQGMELILDRLDALEGNTGDMQKAELENIDEEPPEDEEYPDDGYEDDDEEDEEVEKGCSKIQKSVITDPDEIKKAREQISSLESQIEELRSENNLIRKAVLELEKSSPRDRKVRMVPIEDEIKKAKEIPAEPAGDNPAVLMAGQFGGGQ